MKYFYGGQLNVVWRSRQLDGEGDQRKASSCTGWDAT